MVDKLSKWQNLGKDPAQMHRIVSETALQLIRHYIANGDVEKARVECDRALTVLSHFDVETPKIDIDMSLIRGDNWFYKDKPLSLENDCDLKMVGLKIASLTANASEHKDSEELNRLEELVRTYIG